jgi:hypothetical protein
MHGSDGTALLGQSSGLQLQPGDRRGLHWNRNQRL